MLDVLEAAVVGLVFLGVSVLAVSGAICLAGWVRQARGWSPATGCVLALVFTVMAAFGWGVIGVRAVRAVLGVD